MKIDYIYEHWLKTINEEKACGLATILRTKDMEAYQPARIFLDIDGNVKSSLINLFIEKKITENLTVKLQEKNPTSETIDYTLNDGNIISIFLDIFTPPVSVMIFGAGHDAIPVAKKSVALGYRTIVVDPRESFNSESNFPHTQRVITHPEHFKEMLRITDQTHLVVMNHHIEKDRETLAFALSSNVPYVGVLGPKSRRDRMLDSLKEEGIEFTTEQLQKMHNPIGLDIGAETPEEIAISILAEIIAVQKNHSGGFLHNKEKIHKFRKVNEIN